MEKNIGLGNVVEIVAMLSPEDKTALYYTALGMKLARQTDAAEEQIKHPDEQTKLVREMLAR